MRDRERYDRALSRQRMHRGRIYPQQITLALDLAGLYGPEVDRALGGEEPMVDEWEAGTRTPTHDELVALADLTGMVTVEFFYMNPAEVPPTVGWLCGSDGCVRLDERQHATAADDGSRADVVPLFASTLF